MGRVLRRTCWVLVCVLAACGDRRNTVSVDGALELAPAALDFQQVAVHDQRSLAVTLRNSGRGRLDLTSVTSTSPHPLQGVIARAARFTPERCGWKLTSWLRVSPGDSVTRDMENSSE